jgi:hypothetical protein
MIARLYHRSYIDFFKEMRDNLGEQRQTLRELSKKVLQNPTDSQVIAEANLQFNRHTSGPFRYIASLTGGLAGFLIHEKDREELILRELDLYHFERIMHTLAITMKEVQTALERCQRVNFFLNSRCKGNIHLLLSNIERLSGWINVNCRTDEVTEKNAEIAEIIERIRSNSDSFFRPYAS